MISEPASKPQEGTFPAVADGGYPLFLGAPGRGASSDGSSAPKISDPAGSGVPAGTRTVT